MARCIHCNKFVLIKRNSGYCKGCEDYLKAESIKKIASEAEEAERLHLAEEERIRREVEETERLRLAEEERIRQEAEEAERLRLAEEERIRREAEEAERLRLAKEARICREAEEAERLRLAEEERIRREAEEAEQLRLAEEERIRREVEEAERLRLAEEERIRQEAEEAERLRLAEEERTHPVTKEIHRLEQEHKLAADAECTLKKLGLSTRVYNCLQQHGINTADELFSLSEVELMSFKNLGTMAIGEILHCKKEWVAERNLIEAANKHVSADEDEHLLLIKSEHNNQTAEETRRLEEERKQAEEAERLRLAEEERIRQEAEEAERLRLAEEESIRQEAEEAERLRLAEEERIRQEAEEAERLRLAEEERIRREAEDAERLRLAEEERIRREAEEAERLRQAEEARIWREAEEAERLRLAEEERIRREEKEAGDIEQKQRMDNLAKLQMMWNPQEYLRGKIETLLSDLASSQEDLFIVSRKGSTTIRRKLWDLTKNWLYIAKVHYKPNALVVSVSTNAPEFSAVQEMLANGFISPYTPDSSTDDQSHWLDLFVEVEKAERFFSMLLQEVPHTTSSVEVSSDVFVCPEAYKNVQIEEIGLSMRVCNRLKSRGVYTLGALCALTESDIQGFDQLGTVAIGEILHRRKAYIDSASQQDVQHTDSEIHPNESSKSTTDIPDDIPLEKLNLSVRAYNALMRGGIRSLDALCKLSEDELLSIKSLGAKSVKEVLQCREEWCARLNLANIIVQPVECPENGKSIPLERLGLSVRAYNGLSRSGIKTFGDLYPLTEDQLHEIDNLGKLSVTEILQCRENWTRELLSSTLVVHTTKVAETFESVSSPSIHLPIRSFEIYLQSISKERTKEVLLQRMQGKTFEEIASQMNVTRSRIQQLENKFWSRMAWGAEQFTESKYVVLFEKYAITEKEFETIFEESYKVWYIVSKLGNRTHETLLPLQTAMSDDDLPEDIRGKIQAFYDSIDAASYIEIDGELIPAIRMDVEKYILSHYCCDETLIDDFIEKYNNVLADNGYSDESLLITDAVRYTRYNAIYDYPFVLCSFKRRIRYYPIESYDIPALIDALHLESYQDIEISARKLLIDHPALMDAYDIRNEYEMHNLLRKQNVDKVIDGMEFGKMPTIRFGDTDRTSFILDMLFDLAPISREDFTVAISEKTGERPEFVLSKAEYWDAINVYLHDDMLTIDSEEMPEYEKQALLASLNDDCYTLEEIQKAYTRATGNSDTSLLSPYNLKRMGFKVYSGYVVRNHASAHQYFRKILTSSEIIDYSVYADRYTLLGEWSSTLNHLKDHFEVVEFAPYQLVRRDRLERFGVTIESLHAFCDEVFQFVESEQYFTIYSLRKNCFDAPLFSLGFDDWFYSSILREDNRFANIRIGSSSNPTLIFCNATAPITRQSFIEYLLDGGSMDRDDLFAMMETDYNVVMDKYDICKIISDSDMYYDPTMGKVYANKDLYYEEV